MTIPRALRISLRGVSKPMRALYVLVVALGLVTMVLAARAGLVAALPMLAIFLIAFLYSAPYVLGQRWRASTTDPAQSTRRPVIRRLRP